MSDVMYEAAPERKLRAYLATPRGEGPWPGVVVVMDPFGLSDDIRLGADRLATAGLLAFAPDLYSGRGIRCVVATLSASRSGRGEACEDIEAARRWLSARKDCTGTIGIIGFCIGGSFALLSAPRYAFAAASVNYGEVPQTRCSAWPAHAPSSPATERATAGCGAARSVWRTRSGRSGSSTTSRSTPTPATAS